MKHLTTPMLLATLLVTIQTPSALGQHQADSIKKGRLMPNGDVVMNDFQTLPIEQVLQEHRVKEVQSERLTSSISPVVVRQNDPDGPKYQEGLGYRFLVYTAAYPGLCAMDDGKLVMTFSTGGILTDGGYLRGGPKGRNGYVLFSDDDGLSWSQPRHVATMRGASPINLGGSRLMLRVGQEFLLFSEDAGQSWSEPEPIPDLPDGRRISSDVALNGLVDDNFIAFIFYTQQKAPATDLESVIRKYDTASHTWGDPSFLPASWYSNEGAITQANNGDLVAVLRSSRPDIPLPGVPMPSDHWTGLICAISKNNGLTWSRPSVELLYGHVHQSLLPLPDGRILMTYAARIGELDGRDYNGIEAVVSYDHGRTWDWKRRYILFRGTSGHMQAPQSVRRCDGKILTSFMHHSDFPWATKEQKTGRLRYVPHVSVVIWSMDQ